MLLKVPAAFAVAALLMGTGPLSGPLSPAWLRVKADLAGAHPAARLAVQAHVLLHSATPRPDAAR